MKKLTKRDLINALCAVQLEHAKKKRDELKWSLIENRSDLLLRLTDFLESLCSDDIKLYNFICDNFDNFIHCKFDDETIRNKINDRRAMSSEYSNVRRLIECPYNIKNRVDYLRDPMMTVTIEDGQTIYENETLEAERKRIFED